jgi:hypothetical protein
LPIFSKELCPMRLSARPLNFALCLLSLTFVASLGFTRAGGQAPGNGLSGPPVLLPEYQARAPRTCTKLTTAPSLAQAVALAQCAMDGISSGQLFLTQSVNIEMGTPRPFVYQSDAGLSGIDLNAQVYPLRGSYTGYLCNKIGSMYPTGHSCLKSDVPEATGKCWKTSFGDYKCLLKGAVPKMEGGMPPPPVSY